MLTHAARNEVAPAPHGGPQAEPETLRVVVVDDEPLARECLRMALEGEPGVRVVAECADGAEAVEAIRGLRPDLVFLDVEMPELGGFEVIERVGPARMPAVVFVTAFEEHAVRAFEVHAVDYVLKPFDAARFREAFRHARLRLESERGDELTRRLSAVIESMRPAAARRGPPGWARWLTVPDGARTRFLSVEDVDWLEAEGNYVRVHAAGRSYLLRAALGTIAERLDPLRFMRIHRSTVVNLARIVEVERWFGGDYIARLQNGQTLRISRTYRDQLLQPFL